MSQKLKFAWIPLPVHRLHSEPDHKDWSVKVIKNGWISDGWIWLKHYRSIKNIYGERIRERLK